MKELLPGEGGESMGSQAKVWFQGKSCFNLILRGVLGYKPHSSMCLPSRRELDFYTHLPVSHCPWAIEGGYKLPGTSGFLYVYCGNTALVAQSQFSEEIPRCKLLGVKNTEAGEGHV